MANLPFLGLRASDLGYYIIGPEGATEVNELAAVDPPLEEPESFC